MSRVGQWATPFIFLLLYGYMIVLTEFPLSSSHQQLMPLRSSLYVHVLYESMFTYACERKRNLLCSPAAILSKNKTNTLPLPSNHPPCRANIHAKLHSATSPSLCLPLTCSKRHTHTQRHTHTHTDTDTHRQRRIHTAAW